MNPSAKLLAAAALAFAGSAFLAHGADPPKNVTTLTCSSKLGERKSCAADTSSGVVLLHSTGESACLLGRTWGYDNGSIWVSDGCTGEFVTGQSVDERAQTKEETKKSAEYIPNAGFRLYDGEHGQIYMRLFTYVRYLNQKGLDPTYTDYFGVTHTVQQRQDVQLNKFFMPFSGWFLTPKFRYYLYVWSSNPSQGDPAQVVGGGNISYVFNRFVTLSGGIGCLPTTRSTEGQFPYWLTVDNRYIADEFFRGSYTSGFWVKGEFATKFKYMAMIANNLSTLGVSASQLDNTFDTMSVMLQWLPTTGENGLYGTFGDFDYHEKVATRFGAHFTRSTEDKQSQPGTTTIENTQIRLTDGSSIFTPDLFAPGVVVEKVLYQMAAVDAGVKYKGFSLEAEYYARWLSDYRGTNTAGIANIDDHGFQVQASAMAVREVLQVYAGDSEIRGHYGDASEIRAGVNYYPFKKMRGIRWNTEWMHLRKCPVGYTAVPYPVGGNGDVFHTDFEMTF
jgi:Protein of unknown function (DUF3011)